MDIASKTEEQLFEKYLEIIKNYRPIDDIFSRSLFRNNLPLLQKIIRIITGIDDLTLISEKTQEDLKRLFGLRSISLDVLAKDSKGRRYNIELQRSDSGASPERARYHSSAMDVEFLKEGDKFTDLPITYVIFITENDVLGANELIYSFDRIDRKTGMALNDGTHILYVNCAYNNPDDKSDLAKLVHDFLCKDADDMYIDLLAERTRYLKETPKGVRDLSDELKELMDEFLEIRTKKAKEEGKAEGKAEGRAEGKAEGIDETKIATVRKMLELKKYPLEEIALITGFTIDKVTQLAAQGIPANP